MRQQIAAVACVLALSTQAFAQDAQIPAQEPASAASVKQLAIDVSTLRAMLESLSGRLPEVTLADQRAKTARSYQAVLAQAAQTAFGQGCLKSRFTLSVRIADDNNATMSCVGEKRARRKFLGVF